MCVCMSTPADVTDETSCPSHLYYNWNGTIQSTLRADVRKYAGEAHHLAGAGGRGLECCKYVCVHMCIMYYVLCIMYYVSCIMFDA